MPTLANGSGALRINVPKGSSLIIRNQSGVETVTGSSAAREDAAYALGANAFVYGPQTASSDVSISTTGVLTYDIVAGDPTPASVPAAVSRSASTGQPSGLIDPATGQAVGSGGGVGFVGKAGAASVVYDMPIWRKALANARSGIAPALLLFAGDSKTSGHGAGSGGTTATNARAYNEAAQVTRILNRRRIKTTMDSWLGDQNIGGLAGYTGAAGYTLYDPTITTSGTAWAPDVSASTIGGRFWIGTSGGTGTLTMTPANPFDTFVSAYARTGGSATSLPVTINGVAQTAIDTRGPNDLGLTTFAGVTSGPVVLGAPTGGNAFGVGGYAYLSSDPGVVVLQGGSLGAAISGFAFAGTAYNTAPAMTKLAPALTVLKCTTNDINGSTPGATYAASLQTVITNVKAYGDLIVVIDTPGSNANYTNGLYDAYIAQIYALCAAAQVNVVDLRAVTAQTYAASNAAGYNYDGTSHMTRLGYAACAELLAEVIAAV